MTSQIPLITLNNGVKMPTLGYGLFQVPVDIAKRCVKDAIDCGYRLIDTAQAYQNEQGVGDAVKESGIKREEFFITTKVWISNFGYEKAAKSIDLSLQKLSTDYIDLLLIHQPYGDYYGAYRAMEDAYKAGKVRAIGISNFYNDRFLDFADNATVKPTINQIEANVFCNHQDNRTLFNKYDTKTMAWGPLAQGKNGIFTNPLLEDIAKAHQKSVAQVAIRYLLDLGMVVIPKSTHKERMAENFNVLDFSLTKDEIARIKRLDIGHGLIVNLFDEQARLGLYDHLKKYKI